MPGPGSGVWLVDNGMSSADLPEVLTYPKDGKWKARLDAVKSLFVRKYNREPEIFVRVPGRVNLIGKKFV